MPVEVGARLGSVTRTDRRPAGPETVHAPTPSRERGRRWRLASLVGCAGAALAVAACSDSTPVTGASGSALSTTPDSLPSTTSSSPTSADPAVVEAVYASFWPTLTTFDRRYPETQWKTVLSRVSVDPQLSQAIAVAKEQRRNGITLYGQPQPRTPKITVSSKAKAILTDCVDFSRSGQADARTGQRKTVGVARTPVTLTFAKGANGWRVSNVTFPAGKC